MLKILKFKLFWKFFTYYFLAQVVSVLLVGYLLWTHNQTEQDKRMFENHPDAQLARNSVVTAMRYGGESAAIQVINSISNLQATPVYVVDQFEKELLGRTLPRTVKEVIADQLGKDANIEDVMSPAGNHYYVFVLSGGGPRFMGETPSSSDMSKPGVITDDTRPRLGPPPPQPHLLPIVPLVVGVIVSLFSALILAWNFSKPIKALRNSFDEVAKGNLDVSVYQKIASRNDELSELGFEFDQMVQKLKKLIEGQSRLLHHVSHELRSPLARLQIAIGLAKQGSVEVGTTIDRIELEVSRMDKLIGDVLDLSRLDAGIKKILKEKFDLSELLDEIVEDARYEAKVKRIKINKNCSSNFEIYANQELLHRAIENIIRNAIKYSDEDGVVDIECDMKQPHRISILVKDQGSGVDEAELKELFKPFYRGQSGEKASGYGLGLTITKQIIEAHGGEVSAKNIQPSGFVVELTFPLSQS
jgi:two-component system, OmpR family, sensor kinase